MMAGTHVHLGDNIRHAARTRRTRL